MIVQNPFMTVCLHRRSSNGGMRGARLVRRRMERNLECNEPIVFFSLPLTLPWCILDAPFLSFCAANGILFLGSPSRERVKLLITFATDAGIPVSKSSWHRLSLRICFYVCK
ncbi:hypothetical protein CEXT_498601 [Caerostris extrusa]|uniref:Uncharacterized protein n=1 Tax=Caerostris extrusa TaxID=172846 RepID=A0AAV4TGG2_CAEEX|nr:hypothetical protein CEXT_498601 [Caerostris extrusa]